MPPSKPEPKVTRKDLLVGLKKALDSVVNKTVQNHPHNYDWHNGHTSLNQRTLGHGVLVTGLVKHETQKETKFDSDPQKYLAPFGTLDNGPKTKAFESNGKSLNEAAVLDQAKHYGYQIKPIKPNQRPEYWKDNYDTKILPVPLTGDSYTDAWRVQHELAHALTHPIVNQLYGEGHRVGQVGQELTPREALRAVHWEWLAHHKQKELSEQLGIKVLDQITNEDLNAIMSDAVTRVNTGKPGLPMKGNSNKVPLEVALGMVRR